MAISDKERVLLSGFPGAYATCWFDDHGTHWHIYSCKNSGVIGSGSTEDGAWKDAMDMVKAGRSDDQIDDLLRELSYVATDRGLSGLPIWGRPGKPGAGIDACRNVVRRWLAGESLTDPSVPG